MPDGRAHWFGAHRNHRQKRGWRRFPAPLIVQCADQEIRTSAKIARGESTAPPPLVKDARAPGTKPDRILIRDGSEVHVIPVAKIDYVEAQDDYVCFKSEGKSLLKQQTLGEVEGMLDPAQFVRIHRSYILNIDRLSKLELYAKDSHAAILRDGTRLPVSRSGYARLNAVLK